MDGQNEVTIRILEKSLRPYVERCSTSWSNELSIVKFAEDNGVNGSSSYTFFYMNPSMDPRYHGHCNCIVSPNQLISLCAVQRLHKAIHLVQDHLRAVQHRMHIRANTSRHEKGFALGDEVALSREYLRTYAEHLSMKLRWPWGGPFQVNKLVSLMA